MTKDRSRNRTNLINGLSSATGAKTVFVLRSMFRETSSATRISMRTARGATMRTMATYGFRMASQQIGLLTAMDIGAMWHLGDGRGLKMSLGGLRRFTTDDGR